MARVLLIGDGITRNGDMVRRCVGGKWEQVAYVDFSECGFDAAAKLQRDGWRIETVYWSSGLLESADDVEAYGAGIWEAGDKWIGGESAREREVDGKRVIRTWTW